MLASPPRSAEEVVLHPRLYIERLVLVPPAAAEAAFDLLLELHVESGSNPDRYRFPTSGGELVLLGPARRAARRPASAFFPVRVADGWISSRTGLYRTRVELELLRWSSRAAAVGLRPLGHRHHALGFGPYLRMGGEAMTRLRKEIEAWASAWADTRSA
jgi:hypothetical protein